MVPYLCTLYATPYVPPTDGSWIYLPPSSSSYVREILPKADDGEQIYALRQLLGLARITVKNTIGGEGQDTEVRHH